MKYYAMRKVKVNGKEFGFASQINEFEDLPQRNQQSLLNLGWVKAVADTENEPIPRKPKTSRKMNTSTKRKRKTTAKKEQDEKMEPEGKESIDNLEK